MHGSNNNYHRNGTKRVVRGGYSVSRTLADYIIPYHKTKAKKVAQKLLSITLYLLGFSASVKVFLLNIAGSIDGWKANIIWLIGAAFWLFLLLRAIIRFYWEAQEKKEYWRERRRRQRDDSIPMK